MIRTGYSFRAAVGHLDDVIKRLQEIKWRVAPIADRCSTFGFTRWSKACRKADLRPIYGVELAVTPRLGERLPTLDHWTFLAIDDIAALHELIALATGNPGREPSITYRQALAAPGVIRITGERCLLDELGDKPTKTYVGLSPATPKGLYKAAVKEKLPMVAMSNNFYPQETDREFYRITLGKWSSAQSYPQHILGDEEWRSAVGWFADRADIQGAVKNREKILQACKAELKKATLLSPPHKKNLKQMCADGARTLGINLRDKTYAARLKRELDLIHKKQFEDYFYIIADLVGWARTRMVVGPARGSSCGSLVCYLLGITSVDPIPFGLLFERFIDTTRSDLPDIDIDFSDTNRHLLFEYAEQTYGADRVARLGTVGLFKPKSALNQAGIQLKVPRWAIEKVSDSLIVRSSGDSRAMLQLEDTLRETEMGRGLLDKYPEIVIAARMEGHPNNPSQHAAGIVVTEEPVTNYVAVDSRTKSTMCDKKDAEELNLLKIDALGLTQLSIFERTLELIGEKPVSGWLEKLPLDDKKAFDVLNKGHFAGIFQFMGGALRSLVKQVKIERLEDMVAITALARPGPMATGGAMSWVKRRMGKEEIVTLHPMLTELTKETFGITVYQEQCMQVVRDIGKFSWADTSAIRKAMSGRLGNEFFDRYRENFIKGAKENGVEQSTAVSIFETICTFGSWAFNKSHAVAYGIVSYYCCYLKAYYPLEFAAATLDAESEPSKQIAVLRELAEEGIDYVAIDPEHSTERWVPAKRGKKQILVGPLTNIKGIGPAAVAEILDARAHGKELRPALKKRLAGATTPIDTLYPVRDRIKRLHPDLGALNIVSKPWSIRDVQCGVRGDVMILARAIKIAPRDENEAVNVQKRNGKVLTGPTASLNLFFQDDTDEIFCKVDRFKFERLGRPIVERGRNGKALYALKGTVPPDFRMIKITGVRYLGDMTDDSTGETGNGLDDRNDSTSDISDQ